MHGVPLLVEVITLKRKKLVCVGGGTLSRELTQWQASCLENVNVGTVPRSQC